MKVKIILFLLTINYSLLTANCFSQVSQEWVARYPGPTGSTPSNAPYLAVDKNGNSYVAGTHLENDTIKILVVKYNSSGFQVWAKLYKYQQGGCFWTDGIAVDTSGNPCIIGMFLIPDCLGSGNIITIKFNTTNGSVIWEKPYFNAGSRGIKIDLLNNIYSVGIQDSGLVCVKYNQNGDSLWVRRYHAPGVIDVVNACSIDDSMNVLMTGYRYLSAPPYTDTLLVVKYSTNGIFRWARTYRYDNLVNVGTKITTDQYGSVYVGGVTRVAGLGVYLTLKYDRNGIQQWASIYNGPGSGNDNLQGIAFDRIRNSVFVTGGSSEVNSRTCATIKYNALSGDSIWVRRDTGIYTNAGAGDIKIDTSGNSYITGTTYNSGSNAPYDVLTLKYSPQGNKIWQITYNGPYNGADGGYVLELYNLNNIYVCGVSQSGFQVSDYIVIKYSQLVGIQTLNNEIPGAFELGQNYPNPFNPFTRIKFSIPRKNFVELKVYDVLGRVKEILVDKELQAANYEVPVDVTNYSSGVYFYILKSENFYESKKMIIVK